MHPKNVTELYADPTWRTKIMRDIKSFRVSDPEDAFQEVFRVMLDRNDPGCLGRDYVERWDPALGGNFSNWIHTFTKNLLIKRYNRSNSKGGRLIERALIISERSHEQDFPERGTVFSDTIDGGNTDAARLEIEEAVLRIQAQLQEEAPAYSWVEYSKDGYTVSDVTGKRTFFKKEVAPELVGRTVRRDCATTLVGLAAGMEPAELARVFQTSKQFVYTLQERLASHEEVLKLKLVLKGE